MGACLTDRLGDVLRALTRMRPWETAVRTALAQLRGDVERHRSRLRYRAPWDCGLAVGAGAVAGACQQVIQRRVKRAGRRGKPPGMLHVVALRRARLNGPFQAFWANRTRVIQTSA
jgi:hypothetical protein